MSARIEARLQERGITLPSAATPVGNYLPWVRTGSLVVVSGQLPLVGGQLQHAGIVGRDVLVFDAYQAARTCAINLLAQLRAACDGDLDRLVRVVRLGGFVACAPDFTEHAKVINGASDLMVEVLRDDGKHARAAVGCSSLPMNACVEVEGMFEIRG